MVQALIAGQATAAQRAQLAKGTLRNKIKDLELALDLPLTENQRFLLARQYEQIVHPDRATSR